MLVSRLSRKGQVTIPKKVRESLRANAGDLIQYEVEGDVVRIRRAGPFDRSFHAALSGTLTEWASPEDEEAFRDFQRRTRKSQVFFAVFVPIVTRLRAR